MHVDDLNLAVLAACRLCFLRYFPVADSGKDTGEKDVVVVLQKIDTLAQTDFGHVRRV